MMAADLADAGVAQSVEQLICNQQVGGSSPSTSSTVYQVNMGEFPSGQRGQTVNLLAMPSVVRIHLPPPNSTDVRFRMSVLFFVFSHRFSVKRLMLWILPKTILCSGQSGKLFVDSDQQTC